MKFSIGLFFRLSKSNSKSNGNTWKIEVKQVRHKMQKPRKYITCGVLPFFSVKKSEPEGIRTPNLLIRSQVHYPVMLRVQVLFKEHAFLNEMRLQN